MCGLKIKKNAIFLKTNYTTLDISIEPLHDFLQTFDTPAKLEEKVSILCDMLAASRHVVVHTGAGISTAAGEN